MDKISGMLGMGGSKSFGGDSNYHSLSNVDYSDHSVHRKVKNNQLLAFRRDHTDGDDLERLSARGFLSGISGMLGHLGGSSSMNIGGDSNSHTHSSVDYSDHSVHHGVKNNQVIGFRRDLSDADDGEGLNARGFREALGHLSGGLGMSSTDVGGDRNYHEFSGDDESDHSVHRKVNNNQLISFRGLADEEEETLQKRSSADFLSSFFSDDDLKDLQAIANSGSDSGSNSVSSNVIINDSYESHTDTSNNKGIIINGKKVDLGNGKAAGTFRSWTF